MTAPCAGDQVSLTVGFCKNAVKCILILFWSQCAVVAALGEIRDGGIDPSNLGKGEWLYYMSSATNQLGGYVPSVTDENSLMVYLKSQGTRYLIVKAATSDQLFNGTYAGPQFTSNLVNTAHVNGLLIFGYNRSYGADVPAEIAIADYVFAQGADGFVWDAEAEWESNQNWIGTNGPALAWQLCSAVRSNWPTKFLAHAPFPIISYHTSFPYKEFGYWSDTVMPQIYHFSAAKAPSAAINWTDVNWTYYQTVWSNLAPVNLNGLAVYWTNAIKPLAPVQDVYGPPFSAPTPDKDVQEFMDYLAADPNTPAIGGYRGANFFRADLHDAQQWAYISGGTPGTVAGVVNNIVLDNPSASVVGTATSVRTFYLTNTTTPRFEGCGSGTDTNSFGTNYVALAQGTGGNYVEFTPNIMVPGDYAVYQWHPFRAEASASVPLVINYNGGSTTVYANQQTNDGDWSLLGTFNFAAGTSGNIRVTDAIAEAGGVALADGIKLVFASPATAPPAAPSGLTASAASSSRIDLGWSNNATNAVHNVVARSAVAGGPYMDIAVVPWSSTGYNDTGLAGEATYYYVVRAVNAAGASGNAGPRSATTLPAAPKILLQPQGQMVAAGSNVTFSVVASGAAPLTYQWRFDGTAIAGATESAYTLAPAQASNAGSYSVVVTNGVGSATSWDAVLTVVEGLFTLTVTTDGNGSAAKSPDQTSYEAGKVVAVTASPSAGYAFAGWTGDITSAANPLSVTMWSNIAITANFAASPTDIILDNTDSAVMFSGSWATGNTAAGRYGPDYRFASTAAGGTSTAMYWPSITVAGYYTIYVMYPAGSNRATNAPYIIQTDDTYFQTAINQQVSGGTWRPLMYGAHLSSENPVYVLLSNDTGYSGKVVIADAVRFLLSQADTLEPYIASQPVSQQVGVGDTVTFSVTAQGAAPLSYFWQRDGVPIEGATDSTYTTNSVQLSDSGSEFSCLVSNSYGTALSSIAVLTVVAYPPTILSQPASQTVAVGGTAAFSVAASGTPPLRYFWRRNGIGIAGATTSTYSTNNVRLADTGNQFSCLVSNGYGVAISSNAVLTVVTNLSLGFAADFETGLQGFTIDNTYGSGNGLWHLSTGRALDAGHSSTHSLYYGHNEASTGGGNYDTGTANGGVVISPAINLPSGSGSIWLSFNYLMDVESGTTWDRGYVEVTTDNGASYVAVAIKDDVGGLTSVTGGLWVSNKVDLSAYAGSSIKLRFRFDTGDAYVNSAEGWYVDDIVITTPSQAPVITAQPQDVTAAVGDSATFSVSASGSGPLSYFWRRNGLPIGGGTDSSYTANNVQLADSGSLFSCLVSNAYGTAQSSNAVLTVNPPPPCAAPPVGLVSWWPGENSMADVAGGNNGTVAGYGTFGYGPGVVGQAFVFDGIHRDRVDVGNPASLQLQDLTVEAWIKRSSPTQVSLDDNNEDGSVAGEGAIVFGYGRYGYGFGLLNNGQLLLSRIDVDAVFSTTMVADLSWHHVAVTKSGDAAVFYIDGVAASGAIAYSTTYTFDTSAAIGSRGDARGGTFWGLVDEPAVYSRALTAGEIQAIYNARSSGKCSTPTPPTIVAQPTNQVAATGDSVSFSVLAAGTAPLSYQWRFNGTNLTTATVSSLVLTNVQPADAGSYSVFLSNSVGTLLSSNATLIVNTSPPCVAPPAGLMSWWRAEGGGNDEFGGNHGTLFNGVSFVPGRVGQAFNLSGSNQCVRIPYSPTLIASNYSVEAWVKPVTQVSDSINQDLIFGQGIGAVQLVARTGTTGVRIAFLFGVNQFTFYEVLSTNEIPIGQFSHLVGTWDGAALRLFINGALNAQSIPGAVPVDSGCDFFIGGFFTTAPGDCSGVGQFFHGLVDETSFYRRALLPVEVQALYSAERFGKCATPTPPTIVAQPTNQVVTAGSSVSFSVTATGTAPLSYQWRFNGTNLTAATASSLVLTNVQLSDAGSYSVLVSNSAGTLLSSDAILTVNSAPPCAPPPAGLVSWWQSDGNALDLTGLYNGTPFGGVGYVPGIVGQAFSFNGTDAEVRMGTSVGNFGTNDFTIEFWIRTSSARGLESVLGKRPACNGDSTGLWDMRISNGRLEMTLMAPGVVNLNIISATRQINDGIFHHVAYVRQGTTGTLYIDGTYEVSGSTPGVTYLNTSGEFVIGRSACVGVDGTQYFTGQLDEVTVCQQALSLSQVQSIYNAGSSGRCMSAPPVIVSPPASLTVISGQTATFSVVAGGSPPLSYQWLFETNPISGATGSTLVLNGVQPQQTGSYSVVVTNAYGMATSSNAVLTVLTVPPDITTQPANQTVSAGTAAVFTVTASGSPPLSYQWLLETIPVAGATGSSLVLNNVQPIQAGNYSVVVSNAYGTVTSSNALLTVLTFPPSITSQPQSRTVFQGRTTNFSVAATGTAPLSYQWFFNSNSLPGRTASLLTLTNIQPDQAGTYSVLVTNAYGSLMSSNAYLTVLPPPVCISPPAGLVAWWRAQSNTVDSIGLSDAAFQYLNSGFTAGKVGAAFRLTQGGYLRVPASSDLDLGPGAGLAIEGWIRPDTLAGAQPVAEWNNGAANIGAGLMLNSYSGTGVLEGYLTDTNAKPTRTILLRSPAYTVANLVWQHVALTFDKSSGVAAMYVNGISVAQTNLGTFLPATAKAPVYLGYRASGTYAGTRFFGGLDEMSLYNRGLTAAEIQSIILADDQGKCPPPPPSCVPPLSGIVAWWRGQSNALDSVDSNNGIITNSVTYNTGKVATCFQFVTGYIRVPAASNLNVGVGPGLTIELWTKPSLYAPQPFVEWNSGTGAQGPTLCIPTSAPIVEANLVDTLGASHLIQSPLGLFTNNVWQHLAVTYDKASGSAALYFNGIVVTQRNLGTFTPRTASNVYLGYRPPGSYLGSGLKFTGSMDEISLCGRALGSNEVRAIVLARDTGKCATPAPPFIIWQPANQTVTLGGLATFTLPPPAGTPPFAYQWRRSGTNIAGASSSSLLLPGITLGSAGAYSVLVTNVSGSITSAVATLTVNQPPIARNVTAATKQNLPISIPTEKLLLFASDPEGDPLTVIGVGTSTNGAAVALGGGTVTYAPVTGFVGADCFAYTVGDSWGGTSSAFVQVEVRPADRVSGNMLPPTVTDAGFLVRFAAIPGRTYTLQRAESLAGPWLTLTTVTVGTGGLGVYEDTNVPPGGAYYRTVYP